MSFGGDTNAYTDFRSTVYTFYAPTRKDASAKSADKPDSGEADQDKDKEKDKAPDRATVKNVIDAIHQLCFKALLLQEHIDNERGPVLSEVLSFECNRPHDQMSCSNRRKYRILFITAWNMLSTSKFMRITNCLRDFQSGRLHRYPTSPLKTCEGFTKNGIGQTT